MKALFFSDIHGDFNALKKIIKKSEKADIVICAGDLSKMGQNLQQLIDELGKINNKIILIIPGNNETPRMINESIDDYENIIMVHEENYQDKNIKFFGIGGGTISPFNTSYELSEDEIKKKLSKAKEVDCLISHSPPKGSLLAKIESGLDIGSQEVYKWIMKNNPRVCCCAHVHENEGKEDTIGKTYCFNPGPNGMIIDL